MKNFTLIYWTGIVVLILLFCLSFHVVLTESDCQVFPKEHLSFSHTFITQGDVDEYIDHYENASIMEKIVLMNDPFGKKLTEKGILKWRGQNDKEEETKESSNEPIEFTLKELLDSFPFLSDDYAMNHKYIGKTICVTGRVSSVNGEGVLYLRLKSSRHDDDVVLCYDISDSDFLISIKENDVVSITGVLDREQKPFHTSKSCQLKNCTDWKIVEKARFGGGVKLYDSSDVKVDDN